MSRSWSGVQRHEPPCLCGRCGHEHASRASYVGWQPRLSRDGGLLVFIDGVGPAGPAVRIHLASGERRRSIAYFVDQSTTGRTVAVGSLPACAGYFVDFEYGSQLNLQFPSDSVAFDAADTTRFAHRQGIDVVVSSLAVAAGLPMATVSTTTGKRCSGCTRKVAPASAAPRADPDSDGLTNAEEFARGSHPRGTAARYLAEGAAGTFFATRYAIANPHRSSQADRIAPRPWTAAAWCGGPCGSSRAAASSSTPGRMNLGTAVFSAVVESDLPVVVDRLMTWGNRARSRTAATPRRRRAPRPARPGSLPRARPSSASSCSTCCRTRRRRR